MKRCLTLFLSISLLLSALAGCGGESTPPSLDASQEVSQPPKKEFESGSIENNIYTNEYLSLSFTLPESWSFASSQEFAELFGSATEQVQGDLNMEDGPENSTYYEFYAQGSGGKSVIMTVENLSAHDGGKLLTVRAFVDTLSEQYAQLTSVRYKIGESYEQELADRECIILPLTVDSVGLCQHCCVFRSGDYMVTLTFSAQSEEELLDLEACLTEIGASNHNKEG